MAITISMTKKANFGLINTIVFFIFFIKSGGSVTDIIHTDSSPRFGAPITNVTVPIGREAIIECLVENLATFKVAWLRVDTQTILTIHNHVITKNQRIAVTHSEHRMWYLHIRNVGESDRGWYMCQINTDPMKSQVGYLQIVVPPDILDYPTSSDMVVREGSNVTLKCAANGVPQPSITWRRESMESIPIGNGLEVPSVEGTIFNITRVNRLHMGAYLCIASNGVPPSVSKRIMLIVQFPPMIMIQNQLVGAYEGQELTLECNSEAFPKSINYWTKDRGDIIVQGARYETVVVDNRTYKVHMKLTIKNVGPNDFGTYKCVSKNSLGETDGSIKLYQIPKPTTPAIITTTVPPTIAKPKILDKPRESKHRDRLKGHKLSSTPDVSNEITNAELTKEKDMHLRSSTHESSRATAPTGDSLSSSSNPTNQPKNINLFILSIFLIIYVNLSCIDNLQH